MNNTDSYEFLRSRGQTHPVFAVDVRRKEDVVMLLQVLFSSIEAKTTQPSAYAHSGDV